LKKCAARSLANCSATLTPVPPPQRPPDVAGGAGKRLDTSRPIEVSVVTQIPALPPSRIPCLAALRSPHGPASDPASAATRRHSAGADETRRRQELDAQWKVPDAGAHAKVPSSLPLPLRYSGMHKWLITSRCGGMAPWRPASAPSTLLRPPSLSGCAHRPLHPQAVQLAARLIDRIVDASDGERWLPLRTSSF
jgi:hypothetical protein